MGIYDDVILGRGSLLYSLGFCRVYCFGIDDNSSSTLLKFNSSTTLLKVLVHVGSIVLLKVSVSDGEILECCDIGPLMACCMLCGMLFNL